MTDVAATDGVAHGLRRRRITRTVVTGFLAKAAMLLPTVAIARIVVPIFGPERFGVLMTVLSLLALLSVADLGVGGSLVTSISRATGAADYDRVRQLQVNGLAAVSVMAALVLCAACLLFYSDIGSAVFPASAAAIRAEATQSLAVFGVLFALTLPLTLISKIQLGLQMGHIANYWQIAAALINFGAGVLLAKQGMSIPWVLSGLMSGTLICGLGNLALHYLRDPRMRPRLGDVSRLEIRTLLRDSSFYLLLQVLFIVAYGVDTLIVARVLGAQRASVYALSERLFSIVAVAVAIITGPLWAAYGEALGAKDLNWTRKVLRLSTIRISAAALLLSMTLVVLLRPLVTLLSSGRLSVPLSLAVAMGGWRVLEAVGASLSVYMYASQAVRFVLMVGGATAAVSLLVKIGIVGRLGLFAVPVAMSVCYLLLCLLPTLYHVRRAHQPAA